MRNLLLGLICLVLVPSQAQASELDPVVGNQPPPVIKKLDPATQTITTYRITGSVETVRPENLRGLSESQRKERVAAFLANIVKPENLVSEENVVRERSELDSATTTSAWGWRWRGYNSYYGYPYYGGNRGYGYGSYYYRPYWGYSSYGYYPSYGYGGYGNYGYGGYGNYSYGYGSYSYPYYTMYGGY